MAVIMTTEAGAELYGAIAQLGSCGITAAVILTGNYEAGELGKIRGRLHELKARLIHIPENGKIIDIVS